MDPLELIAVRHGETTWNRKGLIQGHKNPGLSDIGREQAHTVAAQLSRISIDQIISSDLRRCRETADIIMVGRDIPIRYAKSFRERCLGALEGLSWKDARARYPEVVQPPKVHAERALTLGIEDHSKTFRPRVLGGLERLIKRHREAERVLLVTHGGVMKVLLAEAEGSNKTFMLPNCALYRFRVDEKSIALAPRE